MITMAIGIHKKLNKQLIPLLFLILMFLIYMQCNNIHVSTSLMGLYDISLHTNEMLMPITPTTIPF